MRVAPVPPDLPGGTLHIASRSTRVDQPKNDKLAYTTHFFVAPEGDHAWVAFGEDQKTVLDHLKSVLEGQPSSGTLAARAGLDPLSKGPPLTSGGFFSLNALFGLGDSVSEGPVASLLGRLKYLGSTRFKGNAPFVVSIRPGSDASPVLTIDATASTRSVDELMGYIELFSSD